MTTASTQLLLPAWINRLSRLQPFFVPLAFVGMMAVILVPVAPVVMDVLLAANLALAVIILLTTLSVRSPLEFSVFPSLLLATTLVRLVLNIGTTRLILSANADTPEQAPGMAGKVIESFAWFVTGNSLVVGVILFVILVVVQFVVITRGATRISEVAARFVLDGMPGKQMAIDADLNAGLIDEKAAGRRRQRIAQEADFYGAMDGAAKFVRGDAVAGVIITLVNITGGFAVGVFEKGWKMSQSLDTFTRLTVGDGLVTQLPALIISVAAGLIVTRSSSQSDLGTQMARQLGGRWMALAMTSGMLVVMSLTGLPALPLLVLAALMAVAAWVVRKNQQHVQQQSQQTRTSADPSARTPNFAGVLAVDTLELEIGFGLVRLVDAEQNGDMLDRIAAIREQLARELGLLLPAVRVHDNMQLPSHDYHINIRGNRVAGGQAYPGRYLAMAGSGDDSTTAGQVAGQLDGVRTREPAFGLKAVWIDPDQRSLAESMGYTVVEAASVLATHLTEVVKSHAHELLTREQVSQLVDQLKTQMPRLVEQTLAGDDPLVSLALLQKVLRNLLRERVPIRDMETIVETLADWVGRTRDVDLLTEAVRNSLARTISSLYVRLEGHADHLADRAQTDPPTAPGDGAVLYCVSLDPQLEQQVLQYAEQTSEGLLMTMPTVLADRIARAIGLQTRRLVQAGYAPVVLTSPQVRTAVRRLLESRVTPVAVVGYNEVTQDVRVESLATVSWPLAMEGNEPHGVTG